MEKDIDLDGYPLHYDVSGPEEGSPVIMMHGYGGNHTTVDSMAKVLSTGMRVYNLDLPGHGQSPDPPEVWGVNEYTILIEKFIRKLGLDTPALIGHSFGGRIAILLGSRNKTGKIVLVDAAGVKPSRPLKYYIKVYSFKIAKKILPVLLGKRKGEEAINKWRGKAGSADYRSSSPMMRMVMSRHINEDLKPAMPLIKAPTLLIWGENDTATPLSHAKTMESLIPDAGLVSFPGCGHYSFLDNPGGVKAVLKEFFKKELS